MITTIAEPGSHQQLEGALGLLLECHERIRRFTAMAQRLCAAHGAPEEQIQDAAGRVYHYFRYALPKHEQDEELSLKPRLLASPQGAQVAALLDTMVAEHAQSHALLDALLPQWLALKKDPTQYAQIAPTLVEPTEALDQLFKGHLAREERQIFSFFALLSDAEQRAIEDEIRARRV